jgi:predicted anti-sigma-YlaC factor YlaD
MTCLTLEQLYSYLEGGLASLDKNSLEAHLKACPSCREAVVEQRYLLQAAETLPAFEVPDDFSKTVLDRIPAAKIRSKANVLRRPAAAGLATFLAALVTTTFITGHSLSQLVLGLNRFLWNNLHILASVLTKGAKVVYLALKVLAQIAGEILETLKP